MPSPSSKRCCAKPPSGPLRAFGPPSGASSTSSHPSNAPTTSQPQDTMQLERKTLWRVREGVDDAPPHQPDGQMRDVDADPAPVQLLRGVDRGDIELQNG